MSEFNQSTESFVGSAKDGGLMVLSLMFGEADLASRAHWYAVHQMPFRIPLGSDPEEMGMSDEMNTWYYELVTQYWEAILDNAKRELRGPQA